MATRLPISLGADWRVLDDGLQWHVQRRRPAGWHTIGYVGGKRDTVLRLLKEHGAPSEAHRVASARLPARYPYQPANRAVSGSQRPGEAA